jgi:hypothetical protein
VITAWTFLAAAIVAVPTGETSSEYLCAEFLAADAKIKPRFEQGVTLYLKGYKDGAYASCWLVGKFNESRSREAIPTINSKECLIGETTERFVKLEDAARLDMLIAECRFSPVAPITRAARNMISRMVDGKP